MIKKMILIPVLIIMCLVFVGAQKTEAASLATVSIDRIGQNGSIVAGRFSDTAATPVFTNKYFQFKKEQENNLLATALTALSLGKNVFVRIDNDGLTISLMWIINND